MKLPLWNPYQGNGTPHIANMQSAFFYPLSWFVFAFGFKYGFLLLYFFKLFFIGFFTYLFLKSIKANHRASLVGSIAFMFSGYVVNWLYWPHTNVIFFLPLSLFLIEKIFETGALKYYLFFSIGLAIALFGGHPETFAHIFLVSSLYFLFKLFTVSQNIKNKLVAALKFAAFSALGFLLASIQLFPFLEYLLNSQIYASRAGANNNFLPVQLFSLNAVPDLFGNQAVSHFYLNCSNYNETTSGYVGLTMLFFAFLAILYLYKEKIVIFFSALALLSLAIAYKAPFIFNAFTSLPIFDKSANHRMLFIFAFSIVVLGTLFLSKILDARINIKKKTFVIFWIFFAGFVTGISLYSVKYFGSLIDDPEKYGIFVQWVAKLYALDLLLLLLIIVFLKKSRFLFLAIAVLVFLEVGSHIMVYEPAINKSLFFPKTALTNFLSENLRNSRFLSVSSTAYFGPNMGSAYQISDVRNYDAMLVKDFSDTFDKYSANESSSQNINSIDSAYLNLVGVKYILARNSKELSQKLNINNEDVLDPYPQAFSGKKFAVFENKNVLPRAFLISPDLINKNSPWEKKEIDEKNPVNIKEYKSNTIILSASNSSGSYIVLTDTFFPGWKAYVDGNEKEIKKTALAFRAVYLEPGNHEIVFRYQPLSFRLGFWVSTISLLGILFGFFAERKKKIGLDKAKKII